MNVSATGRNDADVTGTAYGLRISGFRDPAMRGIGEASWPHVVVSQEIGVFEPLDHTITADRAEVGGGVVIDRLRSTATLRTPRAFPTDQLVHPMLAWLGVTYAHWRGLLAMHGGAFTLGDRAWMILATKGGGKSSTLAALHTAGHVILTDDLVIVSEGRILAGPRCIDLKVDPESILGREMVHERLGERRRILLPDHEQPVPLGGAFLLEYGEHIGLEPVPVGERIMKASDHRALDKTDPRLVLGLAKVPMWTLKRPRDLARLGDVVKLLSNHAGEGLPDPTG
jgi:hypothetical protein